MYVVRQKTAMLRSVALPSNINGQLFLGPMPGRYESFDQSKETMINHSVDHIVCLVPLHEIQYKSFSYASALRTGALPCPVTFFPILDYEVPENKKSYLDIVHDVAARLEKGENILIHCGAGMGRTGIFAISVLMATGIEAKQSIELVRAAGSFPESPQQWEFIQWVAEQFT
jgi:hypothetical protein